MMAKRVNPIGVMRFKPVALWSGIVRANEKGEAEVAFDVPDFSGELRIMAVAYKGDRFGSAAKGMKVADPIILTPALPRFLSPNDSLTMTITAFNSTDTPAQLKLDIETSGGVTALMQTASLDVGANQERFTTVKLRATNQIGKAVVTVRTSAFGESFASVTELPVRPISPFVTDATSGFVDGGDSVTHDFSDEFLPYGKSSYMTLSPFPVVNFAKQLKDLIGYPHGCIEQTVSRAFPQIYLRDIATLLDPAILNTGSPTYFVNEAITKVASMQMSDGGFSYWPGGSYGANAWSTVYATHFLLEAKKAGYAVPENVLKNALTAVGEISKNKTTVDYYFYGPGQKTLIRRIADKSAVYALYVLALGGSPDKNIMNYFRIEKSLLTNDTQYLLAGAFALIGDKRSYLEILPPEFAPEEAFRQSGIWFDSRIRACALMANVLFDADVNNPNIPRLLDYLSKTYQESYWWSTQDEAFTLLAFGKAARMATTTKLEGTIQVGAKKIPYGGGNQRFDIDAFGKKVVMTMKGTGRVYYTIITEGIRSDGKIEMKDKNLQIRREFFNRFGNAVSLNSVKQNDLLIIRLTLASNVGHVENVAISDLLPAGFEIENPRLTAGTDYPFIKNPEEPSYTDIRDDRINMYFNIYDRSPHAFYYMVRAVSAGTFVYAPVVAEAMYDANYVSTSGQGIVKISR
jgi:hypothetical protein